MSDYKKTLNLPDTSFPMKANLTQREPETLKYWEEKDSYHTMVNSEGEKGVFVLHDGPPYANGHLHMGHALNKIIKDIIVKSRNLQGYLAQYIPGWDCHGLPIELKVEQELNEKKKNVPVDVVRRLCREYAKKWVNIQRKEFQRLGIMGEWSSPYLSMTPDYESTTARELGKFMASGSVIRSKKPIHWCCSCHTALAEAEVEYYDHTSPSIFVRFPLTPSKLTEVFPQAVLGRTWIVIWTTTPWTIPDNTGIAVHPEYEYALVKVEEDYYLLAEELVDSCSKQFGWDSYSIVATVKGSHLEGLVATHPFYDRSSSVVLGEHVTLDAGTGCVHTAPGHGREDYEVGLAYGLEVLSPMDDHGRFFESVPVVGGKQVFDANPIVIQKLIEVGNLLAQNDINHSYPHCWRCKNPVIFRATTQWFISMEKNDLRNKSLKAIRNDVNWIPSWGEERIYSMIENRPDWCISRQRTWGVPIVALLCENCGKEWHDPQWNNEIADRFAAWPTGCDYWFEAPIEDIVPKDLHCPHCNSVKWKKETDILDVWFDSGTSFAAVLENRPECSFPADLYLEGSDQHRGWFHSSLLSSMGTRGVPPYRNVLTHGYVVDGEGKKMSKSIGNGIAPDDIISKHGAEILRMWVASVDYREDVRISNEILNRQIDAYRRIRNTCRYLLGNLSDFDIEDLVSFDHMNSLDRYALDIVSRTHNEIQQAYQAYEFYKVSQALHKLCITDLSAFYLDILKDRLYSSAPKSQERRSAQSALLHILFLLLADMAPVLSFTAEEIFKYLPERLRPELSTVFALKTTHIQTFALSDAERKDWEVLLEVRAAVTKAIEPLRRAGEIGHVLDTAITLYVDQTLQDQLTRATKDLRSVLIVSQLHIEQLAKAPDESIRSEELPGMAITVAKAEGEKCSRCWIYSTELGSSPDYPEICPRCTKVMQSLQS